MQQHKANVKHLECIRLVFIDSLSDSLISLIERDAANGKRKSRTWAFRALVLRKAPRREAWNTSSFCMGRSGVRPSEHRGCVSAGGASKRVLDPPLVQRQGIVRQCEQPNAPPTDTSAAPNGSTNSLLLAAGLLTDAVSRPQRLRHRITPTK